MKIWVSLFFALTLGIGWAGFRSNTLASSPRAATVCEEGMAGIYPCNKVDLLSIITLSSLGGGGSFNDLWGWTDSVTGKEIVLIGTREGVAFVDISDPLNPVHLGTLPGHNGSSSTWRDVTVYKNHAYVVSEASGQGMQVFDLTQLRSVASPPATFTNTAHYSTISSAHNIFINEASGYAYIVGASGANSCSGGLHMVNLANPGDPAFVGCYSADGYTSDAQCVNYFGADATYVGHEICFASNEDTLTIVDVTDKSNPVQLSRTNYSGWGYVKHGWLTADQNYFLSNDELDERNSNHNTRTYIWNVRDLDAPTMFAFHEGSTPAVDRHLYTRWNLTYQANYEAGLRILDNRGAANGTLDEVAYFDTYPSATTDGFSGAWSVYPYFSSGVLVISSRFEGVFILRHTEAAAYEERVYVPNVMRE